MPYDLASLLGNNLKQFELTLREHVIGGWRELNNLAPHEAHHSNKTLRTYQAHIWCTFAPVCGGMTGKKS
jgi:hypothetical protein